MEWCMDGIKAVTLLYQMEKYGLQESLKLMSHVRSMTHC